MISLPDDGVLFVISGPSGVGKSTLIRRLFDELGSPGGGPVAFSVSATTRAPRDGERHGVDYYFLDDKKFEEMVENQSFLEHARVYDRRYGTPRAATEAVLASGRSVLLDIDVQGARLVRASFPAGVHIYILPPNVETLEIRLRKRSTDSEAIIQGRMKQVADQIRGCVDFDYIIVNDDLDTASAVLQGVVLAELSRRSRRSTVVNQILAQVDTHA